MRKIVQAAAAAMVLIGSGSVLSAQEVVLKLASFANAGDTFGLAQQKLAEELDLRSKGRIKLEIFNNNTAGSNREAIEMSQIGGLDFVVTGLSHATRYSQSLNAVLLPYLWKDRDTMFAALDGEAGDVLNSSLEPQSLKVVGWWDNGFRHVSNNSGPIVKPEDIKGLKLRTLPSKVHVSFFSDIGAIPVPMDFSELVPALQQGVIDGQENPPAIVYPHRIYEAQKFYSLTGHVNEPMVVLMGLGTERALPEDLRPVLKEALDAATAFQRDLNARRSGEMLAELSKLMAVNEVPEETIEVFRDAARSGYATAFEDLGPEAKSMVEAVLNAQD